MIPLETGPIKTRIDGAILTVTLDRPKANAIDLTTSRIMGEVFAEFRDDPHLRVAILTGGGDKFFAPAGILRSPQTGMRSMVIMALVALAVCKNFAI